MQFNVAQLLKGFVGTTQSYSLDERNVALEDASAQHLWGWVRFTRVNGGIWVNSNLRAEVSCICSRCLQDFTTTMRFQFDQTYYPVMDIHTGVAVTLPEDADQEFLIDSHHILDISEALRQSIIVAIPLKPLCAEDCAGFCQGCGVNLNETCCRCEDEVRNPRWGPLLNLLVRKPTTQQGVL